MIPAQKKEEVVRLVPETYIAMIENSVGTKMFQTFYAQVAGTKTNVVEGGKLSCAFYVTSVLVIFGLIQRIHGTVVPTLQDLKESGWREVKKPRPGSVVVWKEAGHIAPISQRHIGFYLGDDTAVSNNHKLGYPCKHSMNHLDREVDLILWNKK